jgi:Fungal specific transcription factor domain
VFRDQSLEVIRKAASRSSVTISRQITSPAVLEQAKAVFFDRYVNGSSKTYDYLSSLSPESDLKSCLSTALDASSLAYFSIQSSSAGILGKAREKYALALRHISEALQSRDLAVNDTILVSVLLLDLFEKLTRTYRSTKSWTQHMNGAIELAKLRGNAQFLTALGLRLFLQLNSTILIGCMQHEVQVPTDLIALRLEASKYVDPRDPKWKFSEIVVRYSDLRVRIRENQLPRRELLDIATQLDAELRTISANVPPEWRYDTITLDIPGEHVYRAHFHVYADHHMTHTWNNIRIIRILLNNYIRGHFVSQQNPAGLAMCLSGNFEEAVAQMSECLTSLSADILASVPQYIHPLRQRNNSPLLGLSKDTSVAEPFNTSSSNLDVAKPGSRDFTPFEKSRCYSLIFPLYVAGSLEVCCDSMREWILKTLGYMEETVGIKEAAVVAGYLKSGQQINPWSLYAMIGSYSFSA